MATEITQTTDLREVETLIVAGWRLHSAHPTGQRGVLFTLTRERAA